MTPPIHTEGDTHHRFPGAIISHGAWRYDGVHLSDRDAQALLCERGIDVTYEAIHPWSASADRDEMTHRCERWAKITGTTRRPPPWSFQHTGSRRFGRMGSSSCIGASTAVA